MNSLPIESILPQLKDVLRTNPCAILVAQPGAGKTTQVPLAILQESWLQNQKILMLEPRRLAARAAARYMSKLRSEEVGQTIGYRVKNDTRVGPNTRIEVITEGVLTRMLQTDPALEGVGAVIFDEFHERSLHADLGLALSRQSQTLLREDLRILIMSATIEANTVSALLDDAPIIQSEGRTYPVVTHYLDAKITSKIEQAVVTSIQRALQMNEGSLLVFLPGAAEIHRVTNSLAALKLGKEIEIAPLYGNLSQEAQDQALALSSPGHRKIVLATSIAETSLTVEGVTVVIDSGLMRVPRFSPRTGMTRLMTVPVSVASADQRRGRAGRLGPGVCYRLWTETEQRQLPLSSTPEIREADLAPLALELAAWGVPDPASLVWLDPPPAAAYQQARELLVQLGALHDEGGLTPHGKRLASLGLHPRLAHMVLQAIALELGALACELAVMLSERDFMRASEGRDADIRTRIEVLWRAAQGEQRADVDFGLCRRIAAEAKVLMQQLGIRPSGNKANASGLLLAFAYPDRVAQRRSTGRFLLSSGRGAVLPELQPLSNERYLVAAELDDNGAESRIYLAAPIQEDELFEAFEGSLLKEQEVVWEQATASVKARQRLRLGAIILKENPLQDPNPDLVLQALISGIQTESLELLPWTRSARQLQQRVMFLHRFDVEWPDMGDANLLASLEDWLGPHLYGLKSMGALGRLNLTSILEEMLTWEQRRWLDEWAPTHIQVPSGSRIPVDYSVSESPALSVRLQEMFGLADTPRIAKGRVPVTLHLLSPAQRPVQVTKDLASFWRDAYFEVKKDLKGRYPKHYWPDDPMAAMPTNRAKPRS
ncbi:ATP-dependent helicase HrpB [Paenibacillus sp. V4I3]|uniref:ATP-dependent helicase HrpB n=1 Tax=unclassified Paenibacillus TaxID=185978 RepID=UPI002788CB4D|nr:MULTISPECIES: ATP-dependent helicase HrpB [unclassified Paenibacillus]MDQ0875535.1 ATP-dependent helicase HrpB [Paenibacillus sp. V4I3]MDQ0888384.1 ATP-dependent helicase HrpB [Paenibacillus sp. V4I9]